MTLETWMAYALACFVISVIPGPSVLMVLGQALAKGQRAALLYIVGDVTGGLFIMAAAYLGLGAVLTTSAALFFLVKWVGVVFIAWLGLKQILEARRLTTVDFSVAQSRTRGSFRTGFVTGLFNPKAILFYMAFLSQFINVDAPRLQQFLILTITSVVVVAFVLGAYAMLAAQARRFVQSLTAQRRLGFLGGGMMLGGSAAMAVTR